MADRFPIAQMDNFQSPVVGIGMGARDSLASQNQVEVDQVEHLMDLELCMVRDELEGTAHSKGPTGAGGVAALEPCTGMEFESEDAAYTFYNEYARRVGFGVTRRSSRRSRTNRAFIAGQYVCSRHGFKKSSGRTSAQSILRVGCKAMMKVKKTDSGKWVILDIIKVHNHELNPENICLFRSHKDHHAPKRNLLKCRRAYAMECVRMDQSLSDIKEVGSLIEGDDTVQGSFMEESIDEGDTDLEPWIGMEFESEEAAYLFYNRYARRVGFGVTRRSSRRSKTNRSFIAGQYVCSRHRFKSPNEKTNNPLVIASFDCKAMLKVKKVESGKWVIIDFIKEHNHEVNPEQVCFFRSHKQFFSPRTNPVRAKRALGVRPNKILSMLWKQTGEFSSDSYTNEACQNALDDEQGKFLSPKNAEVIYEYFMRMQHANRTFFYAMELNEGQQLKSVFWVDARSRRAYSYFGDVIAFDTTYLMDRYLVPFVSFIGVNHHGQPSLMGSALVADKTTRSIAWVFKAWLTAMSGHSPSIVITDYDEMLKEAVAEVFPSAYHCFCVQHILKKLPVRLVHACKAHEKFSSKLEECIHDSKTVSELESRWKELLEVFDLKENEWLQMLYRDRQHWVPMFVKDKFLAGMLSAQKNENACSFFNACIYPETPLKEFLEQYDGALQNRREEEARADFESSYTKVLLKTPSPFEAQLASIYTRGIFQKCQVEVLGMAACHAINFQQAGDTTFYLVKDLEAMKDYSVTWGSSNTKVTCACKSFEFRGFLCRHAMTVLVASSVYNIPSPYILERWTKDAKHKKKLDHGHLPVQNDGPESTIDRFNDLCQRSIKFAEEGSLCKETYHVALAVLQEALEKVVNKNESLGKLAQDRALACNSNCRANEGSEENSIVDNPAVLDPWRTYQLGLGDGS